MIRPLVVTGVGRSGTGYISQVLGRSGLPCGHETVFRALQRDEDLDFSADSSWFAPPRIGALNRRRAKRNLPPVVVIHQVRHPLRWIRSWTRTRTSRSKKGHSRYLNFLSQSLLPEGWLDRRAADPIGSYLELWVKWNELVEALEPHSRHRVEDLDADRIVAIGSAAGRELSRGRVERSLHTVSKSYNTRGPTAGLTWGDLEGKPYYAPFVELGRKYGYDCPS